MKTFPLTLAALALLAALPLHAQQTQKTAPTTRPKIEVDLSTPQAALKTYLLAQQALDLDTMKKVIYISDAPKKPLVDVILNYYLWAHYLERQAILKFGATDGLTILSHVRSLDDQLTLDLKRAPNANVDYNLDKNAATLFLKPEKDRPEGLQVDKFTYLDVYKLVKVGSDWKIDYLKTYTLNDPEKENEYLLNATLYPKIAHAMKDLSEQIRAGKFREAAEVKNALEAAWSNALPSDDPK